ncbi:MAG: hypothetical protein KIS87_15435, partial [Phycisphaeraceae bacterium]|nr:hypothetical protein [Phycisphaeraceae bacterium]
MLCLKCRTLWPAGSARCGSCGGSFGGRLCPKGHPSPSSAARCVRCGSSELTLGVAYLSLRPFFL